VGQYPVAEEAAVLVDKEVLAPVDVHQHRDNVRQSEGSNLTGDHRDN
jgi:hypothetical protein